MNLQQSILKSFQDYHPKGALFINEEAYTYAQLEFEVKRIWQGIKAQNLSKGDFIGIETHDHLQTYAAVLATFLSPYGFVPLNVLYPTDRLNEIISFANIKLVISAKQKVAEKYTCPVLECSGLPEPESEIIPERNDEPKCVLFTSGSTGKPKGVPYNLVNLETSMDSFFNIFRLQSSDNVLQMFELSFDMSLLSYLPAFLKGAAVFTIPASAKRYLNAIKIMQQHKITFAAMVPSTLMLLKKYMHSIRLPDLKYSVFGGEPLYKSVATEWKKCVPRAEIHNISGPAECCMACMSYKLEENPDKWKDHNNILAFGHPWKNTQAIVLNDSGKRANIGEIGELCFSGKNVMRGYLGQEKLNRDLFVEVDGKRFYKTGDMAFVDEEDWFYSCGRQDAQIKVLGYKVELAEVEQIAREQLNHNNLIVLKSKNEQNLDCIVMALENFNMPDTQIMERLKTKLPPYMMPEKIIKLERFPRTIHGKTDRQKIISEIGQ